MMAPWRERWVALCHTGVQGREVSISSSYPVSVMTLAPAAPYPCMSSDPRRLKKDLYMFASIQSSSGAQIALTHAAYNYVKKVKSYVVEVES